MTDRPPLPLHIWSTLSPEARVAISAVVPVPEQRIADLGEDHAERAVRHGVIYRKTSGGTESEAGSRFVERMLSVVATCRQQKLDVLDYLTRCCRARLDGKTVPSLLPQASTVQAAGPEVECLHGR